LVLGGVGIDGLCGSALDPFGEGRSRPGGRAPAGCGTIGHWQYLGQRRVVGQR